MFEPEIFHTGHNGDGVHQTLIWTMFQTAVAPFPWKCVQIPGPMLQHTECRRSYWKSPNRWKPHLNLTILFGYPLLKGCRTGINCSTGSHSDTLMAKGLWTPGLQTVSPHASGFIFSPIFNPYLVHISYLVHIYSKHLHCCWFAAVTVQAPHLLTCLRCPCCMCHYHGTSI